MNKTKELSMSPIKPEVLNLSCALKDVMVEIWKNNDVNESDVNLTLQKSFSCI